MISEYKFTLPLTSNELTEFVEDIIFILKDELAAGRLTQIEYEDYIDLIDKSAKRVFYRNKNFQRQVISMTKSLITLPSERYEIYEKQLAEKDAEINRITTEKDATISQKDSEIAELKKLLAAISNSEKR